MRVTFIQDQSLKVELQYKNVDEWTECFTTGPITLPGICYLGFSSETGELSDNHDIISVTTTNRYATRQYTEGQKQEANKPGRNKGKGYSTSSGQPSGSGGWSWFFLKIVIFLIVVVGGYVGWTMYRSSNRSSRF